MFPSSRPPGGVAPPAGPLDATVVGAALDTAWPPLRAPHSHDTAGRGYAAHADATRGVKHEAGWWSATGGVARGPQQQRRPSQHARRRGQCPHGETDNAGRGYAARADTVASRTPRDGPGHAHDSNCNSRKSGLRSIGRPAVNKTRSQTDPGPLQKR